ncbi:DddA-like double-stranded DNA deaminase toxin [Saccharopolyspora hirsuta]|uniref:DddA-like double-stranded DNA deaminase toxin n=1 Tax=Saccharopolyspora hirsuta TaxID=1837 RepID=UPI001478934A|nr:DddA-like double-stranded DNA deaminase toxin [Saccharopolyspora hirsuta]
MSALGELDQALAQVIGRITDALERVTSAQDATDEGAEALRSALDGTNALEAHELLGTLGSINDNLIRAYQAGRRVLDTVTAYRQNLEVREAVDSTPPSVAHPSATKSQGIQAAARDPQWARNRLAELPKREHDGPTHGTFIDTDGTRTPLVSGTDQESHTAAVMLINSEHFPDMPSPNGSPAAASHVETKAAQRMRDSGQTFGVVVVNNSVCGGDYGCRSAVQAILPQGACLVVWSPNATSPITLNGKAKP